MKTRCVLASVLAVLLVTFTHAADPVGTAFTYQGRLTKDNQPVSDTVNLIFRLYASATASTPIEELEAQGFPISNGLFTIDLDFGENVFTGEERWLEIVVDNQTLAPRQPIMPAPYAITALNAPPSPVAGTYTDPVTFNNPNNIFTGSFAGVGSSLTGLNASNMTSGTIGSSLLSGTYVNALNLSNSGNQFAGAFSGSGAGLTSLNATNLASGIVPSARMSGAYAGISGIGTLGSLSVSGSTMLGTSTGNVGVGTSSPAQKLHVVGTTRISTLGGSGNRMVRANASGDLSALPPGTTSQFLRGDGSWASPTVTESDPTWAGAANQSGDIGRTGRVGIGTTTPSFGRLHVVQNTSTLYALAVEHLWTGSGSQTAIAGVSYSQFGAGGEFQNLSSSGTTYGVRAQVSSPNGFAGHFTGGRSYFSGNVGIGVTNPTTKLHVVGDIMGTGQVRAAFGSASNATYRFGSGSENTGFSSPTSNTVSVIAAGSERVRVNSGGLSINGSPWSGYRLSVHGLAIKEGTNLWATFSDARLKRDIERLPSGSLDQLLSIHGYTYYFTDEALAESITGEGQHTGFLAQEVESVFPDWVRESENGYLVLEPGGLLPHLIEALRELRQEKDAQVEGLQSEIDELRVRLALLESALLGMEGGHQ